jgi:hypothetical protein
VSDRQLMRAVRAACEELISELDDLGWEFDNDPPLHPPGVVTLEHLGTLESLVGALPDPAVDFWLEVGGIDLSGDHEEWDLDGVRPFVFEAPVEELIEDVARAAQEEEVRQLPVSPDFAIRLQDASVVGVSGHLPLIDHLRDVLLGHAGLPGFTAGPPEELAAVAEALPRF